MKSKAQSIGKKLIFVAYYLDNVGVKGNLRIGNASVSHQHANMIVTLEHATSNDVIAVARTMQEKVYKTFGLLPQSECELVGFKAVPITYNAGCTIALAQSLPLVADLPISIVGN